MINRENFYKKIRVVLFNKLTQYQVDGINSILDEYELLQWDDIRGLAYILATCYHETDRTMMPVEEYGKGKHHPYGDKIKKDYSRYEMPDELYYGRGLVQLTWYENYEKAGRYIGVNLLENPKLALEIKNATKIAFEGMKQGWFTTKKLSDYINDKCNFVGARHIINGSDDDELVASYANGFLTALK